MTLMNSLRRTAFVPTLRTSIFSRPFSNQPDEIVTKENIAKIFDLCPDEIVGFRKAVKSGNYYASLFLVGVKLKNTNRSTLQYRVNDLNPLLGCKLVETEKQMTLSFYNQILCDGNPNSVTMALEYANAASVNNKTEDVPKSFGFDS